MRIPSITRVAGARAPAVFAGLREFFRELGPHPFAFHPRKKGPGAPAGAAGPGETEPLPQPRSYLGDAALG